jgi:hypothetical protein
MHSGEFGFHLIQLNGTTESVLIGKQQPEKGRPHESVIREYPPGHAHLFNKLPSEGFVTSQ